MLWDGLDFFGFDDTKLARLNGAKTSYLDKFKNKKWILMTMIVIVIGAPVFASQASKIGEIKKQDIVLTDQSYFTYNASEVLTMNGVNHFNTEQLLPRIRKFQQSE